MKYPVSIKGILNYNHSFLFLKNPRDEFELPGGRIELGETPQRCLQREIAEETGIIVTIKDYAGSGLFEVIPQSFVFILAFHCEVDAQNVKISDEHSQYIWASIQDLYNHNIPEFYRQLVISSAQSKCAHRTS